jgi:uncharacterized membrane protein YdjX (TVP38/TMEM64 family)
VPDSILVNGSGNTSNEERQHHQNEIGNRLMFKKYGMLIKAAIVAAFIAAVVFLCLKYDVRSLTPLKIKHYISSFGAVGPLIFLFFHTVRSLVMFPMGIFSTAGGLAFGIIMGSIYNISGAILSAVLAFFVARYLGSGFVKRLLGNKLDKINSLMDRNGFEIVFYLRFFTPFDPLSYVCGLSGLKFRSFFFATMLQIIPGTIAYSFFGSAFSHIKRWQGIFSADLILPTLILGLALLIPMLVRKLGFGKIV